jgi:hypothetical protein
LVGLLAQGKQFFDFLVQVGFEGQQVLRADGFALSLFST